MSCALCEKRKEKRFCPALHDRICPQCCGEQREVTLDCPSDCVYLQQAREHEKAGGGHGVFFHQVIEGLREAAADAETGEVGWDDLVG